MLVILEDWDGIELICRLISKFESRDLSDFKNNHAVISALEKYKKDNNYKKLAYAVFGGRNDQLPNKPKSIYELVRQISHSIPVVIPKDVFDGITRYIDDIHFAQKRIKTSRNIQLSNKQRKLEGTKWWIYFYDELSEIINQKPVKHPGISKGLLELIDFGKAKLTRLKHDNKKARIYSGLFRTFRNDEYIALKMKMEPDQERDLRMLFFIGSDNSINLSVGLSANVSSDDYTRAVMIEPITSKKNALKEIGFYNFSKRENNTVEIPEHARLFFADPKNNIIRVPRTITSVEKFYSWHNK